MIGGVIFGISALIVFVMLSLSFLIYSAKAGDPAADSLLESGLNTTRKRQTTLSLQYLLLIVLFLILDLEIVLLVGLVVGGAKAWELGTGLLWIVILTL